jgi:hypothetical protein
MSLHLWDVETQRRWEADTGQPAVDMPDFPCEQVPTSSHEHCTAAAAEFERVLAIIREQIINVQLDVDDRYAGRTRLQSFERTVLEDLLDKIALRSGLTAADVRVPAAAPRA